MRNPRRKHRICMIADFFFPNMGGMENHIYQLSQHLIARGHKVIVVTHSYGDRVGVRYLSSFLKVYYLPFPTVYMEATFPLLFCTLPLIRDILIREDITIVHGHGAYSGLCGEGTVHGGVMGLKTVFTDHSLFGFADLNSILTNKLMEFYLTNIDHLICVSYTSKENTALRAQLLPNIISVIPNAVDADQFAPDPSKRRAGRITIVVVSRLVYRKGTDLLAGIIPIICSRHDNVDFIIGGGGPKRVLLEEVKEKHCLQGRVELLGPLHHSQVRDVLVQGDVFLNTSITEAFCIAIVEAACCGLDVVSTSVGGVPEVLPPALIHLAEPSVSALVLSLEEAIARSKQKRPFSPEEQHRMVRNIYTWANVAKRTEVVYDQIVDLPRKSLPERLFKLSQRGPIAGLVYVMCVVLGQLVHVVLAWCRPAKLIDRAPDICSHELDSRPS